MPTGCWSPRRARKDELERRRPGRRLARAPGSRSPVTQRPRPDLGPRHPSGRPRCPARHRLDGPRPPARGDGPDPRRRGAGPGRPARDRPAPAAPAVPVARSCPGSAELAERIAAALTEPPEPLASAVLLERHGACAVGRDPAHAVDRLELVEVLCRTWRDALLIRAARAALAMVDTAQPSPGSSSMEGR